MPSATVGGSPSATDGENFAVCLLSLCRVLGAHGELANSGSGGRVLHMEVDLNIKTFNQRMSL